PVRGDDQAVRGRRGFAESAGPAGGDEAGDDTRHHPAPCRARVYRDPLRRSRSAPFAAFAFIGRPRDCPGAGAPGEARSAADSRSAYAGRAGSPSAAAEEVVLAPKCASGAEVLAPLS